MREHQEHSVKQWEADEETKRKRAKSGGGMRWGGRRNTKQTEEVEEASKEMKISGKTGQEVRSLKQQEMTNIEEMKKEKSGDRRGRKQGKGDSKKETDTQNIKQGDR